MTIPPVTLAAMVAGLFERATRSGQPETGRATRGLQLKARIVDGQRQLLLSRPDVQPSDLEVTTCAKHGGFGAFEVSRGPLWQLIAEQAGKIEPLPAALTCGTCGNATPAEHPLMVECSLGWERHDGVMRDREGGRPGQEWVSIPQGHGGLPLPLLSATHGCVAVLGQGHPGWTARA